jgi:branched-chain amino acid transport system substrate-binding protein
MLLRIVVLGGLIEVRKIYLFLMFIIILLVCFLGFFYSSSNVDKQDETIKIGVIISQSTQLISLSSTLFDIMNLSFSEINNNGGILGKQVELFIRDGGCSFDIAEKAAKDLVENVGVKVIVGGICSDATLGAARVTEPNRIIFFSPASTSSEISNAGDFVFRNVPSNLYAANLLAEKTYNSGYRKIGSLSQVNSYTSSFRKFFFERFEELGGEVVSVESFVLDDTDDYTDLINNIKKTNPDSLLVLAQTTLVLNNLLTQIHANDLYLPIYGGEIFSTLSSGQLDNITFVNFKVAEDSTEAEILIEKLKSNFDYKIYESLSFGFISAAYDLPKILKKSFEGCDEDNTFCIRDNLYVIYDFNGVMGSVTFDEFGDPNIDYSIFVFDDKKSVLVE